MGVFQRAALRWVGGRPDRPAADHRGRLALVGALAALDEVDDWFEQLVAAPTSSDLLNEVPDWAAADIEAMAAACQPPLSTVEAPVAIAPVFAGSFAVGGADADLVAGGVLIDVKATKDVHLS